jgi:hypothetical protein
LPQSDKSNGLGLSWSLEIVTGMNRLNSVTKTCWPRLKNLFSRTAVDVADDDKSTYTLPSISWESPEEPDSR